MSFLTGLIVIVVLFVIVVVIFTVIENNKVNAMSPSQRAVYTYGALNSHLVCPHCQTKGVVRAKQATRTVTSKGKVGGILKTNTTSSTTALVTQHHCDQCGTTWDV